MELDDEICLCFHVTKRKVVNFVKRERPRRASQLSECHGAGTGCGWCRPFLEKLWQQGQGSQETVEQEFRSAGMPESSASYEDQRAAYLREKRKKSDGDEPAKADSN